MYQWKQRDGNGRYLMSLEVAQCGGKQMNMRWRDVGRMINQI